MQGGHAVVGPRGRVGPPVEQKGRRRRRVARRGPMQRRVASDVLRPHVGPVLQQHPHHRDRVPPGRRVQRRDALRGRRADVGPARREHGRGRAAVARGRVVQRGRRCRIGHVRVRAAFEQDPYGLARVGDRRDVERGRAVPPEQVEPVLAATAQRAHQRRAQGPPVGPQPRVPTRPRRQQRPGHRRPVQGGRVVQVRPPVGVHRRRGQLAAEMDGEFRRRRDRRTTRRPCRGRLTPRVLVPVTHGVSPRSGADLRGIARRLDGVPQGEGCRDGLRQPPAVHRGGDRTGEAVGRRCRAAPPDAG